MKLRTLALLLALAPAGVSCRDADPAAAPTKSGPDAPPPTTGTASPPPPRGVDVEEAKRAALRESEAQDARAQEILRRFRDRVWDLGRDGLASASGELALTLDGKRGAYRFEFDAARKEEERVSLSTASADEGIHADAHAQAKRFAVLAFLGPYHNALRTLPPVRMHVVGAGEGPGTLVVVPPFKTALGTSYRIGEGGLVDLRGDTDGKRREVARFTWKGWNGRAVLVRADYGETAAQAGDTATTTYEYEDHGGLPRLVRAVLFEGEHRCEAGLTYASWVRR